MTRNQIDTDLRTAHNERRRATTFVCDVCDRWHITSQPKTRTAR